MLSLLFCFTMMANRDQGDKFFGQGKSLQKTMTIAAQNNAISMFTKAKAAYDSAQERAKCDKAIAQCRSNIKKIQDKESKPKPDAGNKPTITKPKENTPPPPPPVEPKLEVGPDRYTVPNGEKSLAINITTNQNDWSINAVRNRDGESFLDVKKKDHRSAVIDIPVNLGSTKRVQEVTVTAGPLTRTITITQEGMPVIFKQTKGDRTYSFNNKGGNKTFTVTSDAPFTYQQNSNLNWFVAEKPDWVMISTKLKKSTGGLGKNNGGSGNVPKVMTETEVKIIVIKNDQPYERSGQIVLQSGDSTITIHVDQKAAKVKK